MDPTNLHGCEQAEFGLDQQTVKLNQPFFLPVLHNFVHGMASAVLLFIQPARLSWGLGMLSACGNKGPSSLRGLGNANVQLSASQDTRAWVQEREKVWEKLYKVSDPRFSSVQPTHSPEGEWPVTATLNCEARSPWPLQGKRHAS